MSILYYSFGWLFFTNCLRYEDVYEYNLYEDIYKYKLSHTILYTFVSPFSFVTVKLLPQTAFWIQNNYSSTFYYLKHFLPIIAWSKELRNIKFCQSLLLKRHYSTIFVYMCATLSAERELVLHLLISVAFG